MFSKLKTLGELFNSQRILDYLRRFLGVIARRLAPQRSSMPSFERRPLGPSFARMDGERIRLTEGELKDWEFRLTNEVADEEAHIYLYRDDSEIGHCDIQRNAHEATIVLWNIVVRPELRHKGLASLMTFAAFRLMLALHKSATFAIRMIRLIKPTEKGSKIQNVGIGVIARKLGFTPEYDLNKILKASNIQLVELIPETGDIPPGYRIVLRTFPLVLIAFMVDAFTGKPFPARHPLYGSMVRPQTVEGWAHDRMIIVGNGNYVLNRDGIEQMISHLATNEVEASLYARRIRPVSVFSGRSRVRFSVRKEPQVSEAWRRNDPDGRR
jgi:GNAT superfamily N-acetyltransferase